MTGPFWRLGENSGLSPTGSASPAGRVPPAGLISSLVKRALNSAPFSRLPSGRMSPPEVALEGLVGVPWPSEAVPGPSPDTGRKLGRSTGPGAAAPPRPPAPKLGPLLLGCQVPVPLLLSDGWENSRAATVPSSLHLQALSLWPGSFPLSFSVAAAAVARAAKPPGPPCGWIPRHLVLSGLPRLASFSPLSLSTLSHSPVLAGTFGRRLACS